MSNATENLADPKTRYLQQHADWAAALDRALTQAFPDIGFTTYWDPLAGVYGSYVTARNTANALTREQKGFIQGFMAGIVCGAGKALSNGDSK